MCVIVLAIAMLCNDYGELRSSCAVICAQYITSIVDWWSSGECTLILPICGECTLNSMSIGCGE